MSEQKVRVSSIPTWLACAKKAEALLTHKPESTHIGPHVGSLVHQKITGHKVDTPKKITFDSATPTLEKAKDQAAVMAAKIKKHLDTYSLAIHSSEEEIAIEVETVRIAGHYDLLMTGKGDDGDDITVLIDIKTGGGANPPESGWTQLACYGYLCSLQDDLPEIDTIGMLYCQRKLGAPALSFFKSAEPLIQKGEGFVYQASKLFAMDDKPTGPSRMQCATCPIAADCEDNYYA